MQKDVFQYWNGSATVFADPMAVHRELTLALDGNPQAVLEKLEKDEQGEYRQPLPVALQALGKLLAAVRQVFQMPAIAPATGEGATDDECLAAVNAYLAWADQKKTRRAGSPTCSPPTAPACSAAP